MIKLPTEPVIEPILKPIHEPFIEPILDRQASVATRSALRQAFYLSQQFRDLRIETADYRLHPVLGGISSTRWSAYDSFSARHSKLVDALKNRPAIRPALQLVSQPAMIEQPTPPTDTGISRRIGRQGRLSRAGLLAGDQHDNLLTGSSGADVLIGLQGHDRLSGEGGGDILCGGPGRDAFVFSSQARTAPGQMDQITDFQGERGDRLHIQGATQLLGGGDFSGTPGEVTSIVWMADLLPNQTRPLQPWMIQGMHLAVDRDGDRQADLMIDLPGISSLDPSWLVFS